METTSPYLGRIRECFPDLRISQLETNSEGLVHDVVIINQERVFRFPKGEGARKSLAKEAKILDLARAHVNMRIPLYDRREDDFATYRLIPGVPLDRDGILGQDERVQDHIAEQLATFLRQLHAVPMHEIEKRRIPQSDAVRSHGDWIRMFEDVQRELFPLMMAHIKDWVMRLFEPVLRDGAWMKCEPALIHGDMGPYHILYNRAPPTINGVIDFGVAGLGDPATDFGCIVYFLGESFLRRMTRVYPEIRDALDRARFWAGTLELQWALAGARSKDLSWLMCHIGGARDAMPIGSRF